MTGTADLTSHPIAAETRVPVLELRDISKSYGAVHAVRSVSLSLHAGEVLALVGDNGAGKSSLIKCIAGALQPDTGQLLIDGVVRDLSTPQAARDLGIETVYQDLSLIDSFDVVENFFLGREIHRLPRFFRRMDKRRMEEETGATLTKLHVSIPSLKTPVEFLSGGQRQSVAIARAIAWGRHIVLLDEPAAALGVEQTEQVLSLVETLASHGVGVILISHNMRHVLRCSDRVVVLRHGKKVADVNRQDATEEGLVRLIMGIEERSGQ